MNVEPLEPEDYVEPHCPLAMEPMGGEAPVKPVPQQRIVEKLDEHMAARDYVGAERLLLYWLEEARLGNDLRGQLMLHGELAGHYRKTGEGQKAVEHAEAALDLVDRLGFDGTISSGTTYVNAATVYSAFGHADRAVRLFERARTVYEANPSTDASLLGGLYNNMAQALSSLGRHDEALVLYGKALDTMASVPGGALEQAITKLNIADLLEARDGMEAAENRIFDLLDSAFELLVSCEDAEDGYRAFVYEKCAPSFSYYGYFAAASQLRQMAGELYGQAAR